MSCFKISCQRVRADRFASRKEDRLYTAATPCCLWASSASTTSGSIPASCNRVENVRRTAHVAALMADAGLVALVSLISPYRADRDMARSLAAPGEFLEVFVDTPLDECRRRDVKGLYAKADAGLIRNFTGISAPYEPPEAPELHLHTAGRTPEALADRVVARLLDEGA